MSNIICNTLEAIEEFRKGKPILVLDDEERENEGDLIFPAELATAEMVNFFISEARGLLCAPVSPEIAERLGFHPMIPNADPNTCNFAVSVDAREGISTGISAPDRAETLKKIADAESKPRDFIKPGHIFPLNAKHGGVLVRSGHTEAAVDLCRLGGYREAGMICEVINPDGSMARFEDLEAFARRHDLKILTIKELVTYRRKNEKMIEFLSEKPLETRFGTFHLHLFEDLSTKKEHAALVYGDLKKVESPLVRVHSENLVNDIFLEESEITIAMRQIASEGSGVLVYIRHEEIDREKEEKMGIREYGIGAQILRFLGIEKMRLLTNSPKKILGLSAYNLEIQDCVPFKI